MKNAKKEILRKFCIFPNLNWKINSFLIRTVRKLTQHHYYHVPIPFTTLGNNVMQIYVLIRAKTTIQTCLFCGFQFVFSKFGILAPELNHFVAGADGLASNRRK